ncbi:hypothetical protein HMPREF3192_00656 [Atopobium deltae]|uniref:Uncharacterized protein n=1 Tax=Atopobium deltae TaxID=1393034 RepID=A0A133XVM8_9ACTN|nr:hypothetical protein HMPREF3192_00656 [Atopobium deltae]
MVDSLCLINSILGFRVLDSTKYETRKILTATASPQIWQSSSFVYL